MDDDANTIAHKISQEAADRVAAKMQEWFDSELGAYDADAVLEMGRKVI